MSSVKGYYVYQGSSTTPIATINGPNITTYTVNNLTPGVNYSFRVTSYDASGIESTAATVSQTTKTALAFNSQINHVIFYGQSLAVGATTSAISLTQPYDSIMFDGGVLVSTTSPAGSRSSFVPLVESGPETPTSGALQEVKALIQSEQGLSTTQQEYKLLGSDCGENGQTILTLSKGQTPNYYSRIIADVTAAYNLSVASGKTYKAQAFMWAQGETDYLMKTSIADYKTRFLQLYSDVNTDVKAITGQTQDIQAITYQVGTHKLFFSDPPIAIAQAQLDLAVENTNVHMACPTYIFTYNSADNLHLTSASSKWMGAYFGLVYKRVVVDQQSWYPVYPISATAQGNILTVKFHVPVPPLVFDTTQVSSIANYGFQLVDSSNSPIGISTVEITGTDTVKITAAATTIPAGSKLRYAWDGDGTGTLTGPVNGPRGNLRDSQGNSIVFDPSGINKRMDNWCVIFEKAITGGGGTINSSGGGTVTGISRLWPGNLIGYNENYTVSKYMSYVGKCHRTLLATLDHSWETAFGMTVNDWFLSIKAINPDWKGVIYGNTTRAQPSFVSWTDALTRNGLNYGVYGWLAWNTDTNSVALWGDVFGSSWAVNYGSAIVDGPTGWKVGEWDAHMRFDTFFNNGPLANYPLTAPTTAIDGTYWDDIFTNAWMPGVFWSAPGVSPDAAWAGMTNGQILGWATFRKLMSDIGRSGLVAFNASNFVGGSALHPGNFPALIGVADFAHVQFALDNGIRDDSGGNARYDNWSGSGNWIDRINKRVTPLLTSTGYIGFEHLIRPTPAQIATYNVSNANYGADREIRARFGAAVVLTLTDGLYGPCLDAFQMGAAPYPKIEDQLVWFGYYDIDTTTGVAKNFANAGKGFAWLGNPVDTISQSQQARTNGVYYREYTNGYVVVNPPGNPATTFTLPVAVKRAKADSDLPDFAGSADPKMNGASYAASAPISIGVLDADFLLKV